MIWREFSESVFYQLPEKCGNFNRGLTETAERGAGLSSRTVNPAPRGLLQLINSCAKARSASQGYSQSEQEHLCSLANEATNTLSAYERAVLSSRAPTKSSTDEGRQKHSTLEPLPAEFQKVYEMCLKGTSTSPNSFPEAFKSQWEEIKNRYGYWPCDCHNFAQLVLRECGVEDLPVLDVRDDLTLVNVNPNHYRNGDFVDGAMLLRYAEQTHPLGADEIHGHLVNFR